MKCGFDVGWLRKAQKVRDPFDKFVCAYIVFNDHYALCDQLRRAVVSIPSNIAEGNGRGSATEYARFVSIARGSLFEVRTQLELAKRLGYINVS